MRRLAPFALMIFVLAACDGGHAEPTLRVLVTNDDGVGAPGISAVVEELAKNPQLEVSVIAPAQNRSGSGQQTTQNSIDATMAETAAGFEATALSGFPADCVLFGVLKGLPSRPDVVVSGINAGQNIGELIDISGTVGAALWAARLGIPAIAVSLGLIPNDYGPAARFTADTVERLRTDGSFQQAMSAGSRPGQAVVLNVNFPSCSSGSMRGIRVVPIGRSSQIVDYTLTSESGTTSTYLPVVESSSVLSTDCTSTLADPSNDVQALQNGFASITPMATDLTLGNLDAYRFLEQ